MDKEGDMAMSDDQRPPVSSTGAIVLAVGSFGGLLLLSAVSLPVAAVLGGGVLLLIGVRLWLS